MTACSKCERPMCPQSARVLADGHVRHMAKGLCTSCYGNVHRKYQPSVRKRTGSRTAPPDPIAVERALAGTHDATLHTADLKQAVAEGTRRGYSAARLAVLLQCTTRTVTRIRAQLVEST